MGDSGKDFITTVERSFLDCTDCKGSRGNRLWPNQHLELTEMNPILNVLRKRRSLLREDSLAYSADVLNPDAEC